MAIAWLENNLRYYTAIREKRREHHLSLAVKASYLILQQLDLALTVMAVSFGLNEMNPWMRAMLDSPLELVVVKLVIPLLIAWLVPYRLLIPACIFLLVVVGWNVRELAVAIW
jgi:hypothetical protein